MQYGIVENITTNKNHFKKEISYASEMLIYLVDIHLLFT